MSSSVSNSHAKLPPIHPGEILNEEFLLPLNISQYRLAKSISVDPRRVHAIVHGERAISAETALLLARFFGTSAAFWMGLQNQYDLEIAEDRSQEGWNSCNRTVDGRVGAVLGRLYDSCDCQMGDYLAVIPGVW